MKTADYIALSEEVARFYGTPEPIHLDKWYQPAVDWNVLMSLAIANGVGFEEYLSGLQIKASYSGMNLYEFVDEHNNDKKLATATSLMRALIKVES